MEKKLFCKVHEDFIKPEWGEVVIQGGTYREYRCPKHKIVLKGQTRINMDKRGLRHIRELLKEKGYDPADWKKVAWK